MVMATQLEEYERETQLSPFLIASVKQGEYVSKSEASDKKHVGYEVSRYSPVALC